jgi:Arc/MetJ-type ribon-helix-helix transcriptional regulator
MLKQQSKSMGDLYEQRPEGRDVALRGRFGVNSAGGTRTDSRKQAVSVRMSRSDVRHIKQLAKRLGARESDVIRFAIKAMLEQLAPLQDPKASGRSLVPVFMEWGAVLMRHFELDSGTLSGIINDGVEDARRVDPDDIQLIAMSGTHRSYLHFKVPALRELPAIPPPESVHQKVNGAPNGAAEADTPEQTLRRYLYEKYLYGGAAVSPNGSGSPA